MSQKSFLAKKKSFIKEITGLKLRKDLLKVFSNIEQNVFFDSLFNDRFYSSEPIPIGFGEFGDDPVALAKMIDILDPSPDDRILEIGTGTGFSTAILSELCREVYTVEFHEELALAAKNRLYNHGFDNIRFYAGDGTTETDQFSFNFEKIIVHASCLKRPLSLIALLKNKCQIVFPMGPATQQQIVRITNAPVIATGENFKTEYFDLLNGSFIKGPYGYELPKSKNMYKDEEEEAGLETER